MHICIYIYAVRIAVDRGQFGILTQIVIQGVVIVMCDSPGD